MRHARVLSFIARTRHHQLDGRARFAGSVMPTIFTYAKWPREHERQIIYDKRGGIERFYIIAATTTRTYGGAPPTRTGGHHWSDMEYARARMPRSRPRSEYRDACAPDRARAHMASWVTILPAGDSVGGNARASPKFLSADFLRRAARRQRLGCDDAAPHHLASLIEITCYATTSATCAMSRR